MANWGNIVDFNNNTNNNVERVDGEVMVTPIAVTNTFPQATKIKADKQMPLIPSIIPIIPTTTIIVPEDKNLEAKQILEILDQPWETARAMGGMYDRYVNSIGLTTHWDWEDRRDITLVGKRIEEGTKDLDKVREACDHNWDAIESPVHDDFDDLDGWKSIRRSDHKMVMKNGKLQEVCLNVVKGKYTCIQNDIFYKFAKELVDFGFNCRNGGTFNDGEMIFLSMKADNYSVCGEPFYNYAVLSNSFNGTKPFALYFTDVRIICLNTYMCATQVKNAVFSVRHTANADWYIGAAVEAMRTKNNHTLEFKQNMEALAMQPFTEADMWEMAKAMYPIEAKNKDKVRALKSIMDNRNELMYRFMEAPDVQPHRNNKYGALCGVTDMDDHHERKKTQNAELNMLRDRLGRTTKSAWAYNYLINR